jgi:hypothetical protein
MEPRGQDNETQENQWRSAEMNIADLTVPQLLVLHTQIYDELRKRGILRSANNPTGDLSEYLFCKAFGIRPATPMPMLTPSAPTAHATRSRAAASPASTIPGNYPRFAI